MAEAIILIVALAMMCFMAAMMAIVFALVFEKKEKIRLKTEEEKEAERLELERQKAEMDALNQMYYGPFFPMGGDKK